jgi:ATP-dependent RNA helicase RhlB
MKFIELNLHPTLQKAIDGLGFESLTPIQEKSIPVALEGRDVTGLSQTGTGKTFCFLIPIIHKLLHQEQLAGHFALIIVPTRELVIQISEEARKLLKFSTHKVATIYGGVGYKEQEKEISDNSSIIVATPGRLVDHLKTGTINLSSVRFFVLDEADRMFDMGFIKDIRYVMKKCPEERQTMLFSATLSYYVIRLASEHLKEPVEVEIEPDRLTAENIEQRLYHIAREEKFPYLINLIHSGEFEGQGIVFTNLRVMVNDIVNVLRRYGIAATGISASLDQKKRIKILKDFKLRKYQYMIATDVASRGLDIEDISVVINFDLPADPESYTHRIGRTARAGKSGVAVNFCSEKDYTELEKIEKFLNAKIPLAKINEAYLQYPKEKEVKNYERLSDGNSDSRNNYRQERSNQRNRERSVGRHSGREHNKPHSAYEKTESFSNYRTNKNPVDSKRKYSNRKPFKEPISLNKMDKELTSLDDAQKFLEKTQSYLKPEDIKTHSKDKVVRQEKHKNKEQVPKEEVSYDKSKRNLFDINDLPKHENKKPVSVWKKIRSFFGK